MLIFVWEETHFSWFNVFAFISSSISEWPFSILFLISAISIRFAMSDFSLYLCLFDLFIKTHTQFIFLKFLLFLLSANGLWSLPCLRRGANCFLPKIRECLLLLSFLRWYFTTRATRANLVKVDNLRWDLCLCDKNSKVHFFKRNRISSASPVLLHQLFYMKDD